MDFKTKLNTINTAKGIVKMMNKDKVDFIKGDFENITIYNERQEVTDYLMELLKEKLDYFKVGEYIIEDKKYQLPRSIFINKDRCLKDIFEKYSYQEII